MSGRVLAIDPNGHPDDELHPPTSDDPFWGETSWWAFSVPERKLAAWFYPLVRTNQDVCSAAVFVWDHTGDTPWDCRYFKQFWHLPMPDGPLSDCTFANGISYKVLEPQMAYQLKYADPDAVDGVSGIAIDVTFRAVMDPLHTQTSGPDGGHLDQLGRFTGTLVLDGETIPVDSFGARDRSWGPRTPFGPYLMSTHGYNATRMPYSHATSETASFLCISADVTDEFPILMGFTRFDGEVSRIASGRRTALATDPEKGTVTRVLIEGVDELGRELHAEGECLTDFLNSCNENLVGWNHLVRWEVNGVEAWGEHHENYSMSAQRTALRAAKGW